MEAPTMTDTQRLEHLAWANEIRVRRAVTKRAIKNGEIRAADVLLDPPEHMRTMKVEALLRCVPLFGEVKARQLMVRHHIASSKTVAGVSPRQRGLLCREPKLQ